MNWHDRERCIPRAREVARGQGNDPGPFRFLGLVLGVLATSSLLGHEAQWLVALAAIILLGVPHGALDGEIARPVLRPRLGAAWFGAFALPYLGLVACVLLSWQRAPVITLAGFLLLSAWHFGREDAGPPPLEALARGGLPIALPVLFHPAATALVFHTVSGAPMPHVPVWLASAARAWVVPTMFWSIRVAWLTPCRLAEPVLLALGFALLPPLTAFAAYFVCVHAPRHMGFMVVDQRAPRIGSMHDAIRRSLPLTVLTIGIGAALWPFYGGDTPDRLLALTIQGLAALTVPHMLLDRLTASPLRSLRAAAAPQPA